MVTYLIDTNVLSELPKARPQAAVLQWFAALDTIAVSAITLEELSFGIERAKNGRRERLRIWFGQLLDARPQIIDTNAKIAVTAGRLRALREGKGRRVAQADMLIAASALNNGLVLATRNLRDFEGCGLTVFNPFEGP
jgi:toxin FitB